MRKFLVKHNNNKEKRTIFLPLAFNFLKMFFHICLLFIRICTYLVILVFLLLRFCCCSFHLHLFCCACAHPNRYRWRISFESKMDDACCALILDRSSVVVVVAMSYNDFFFLMNRVNLKINVSRWPHLTPKIEREEKKRIILESIWMQFEWILFRIHVHWLDSI